MRLHDSHSLLGCSPNAMGACAPIRKGAGLRHQRFGVWWPLYSKGSEAVKPHPAIFPPPGVALIDKGPVATVGARLGVWPQDHRGYNATPCALWVAPDVAGDRIGGHDPLVLGIADGTPSQ